MEQKKNLIVKIIIVSVLAILCCFASFLNPQIKNMLLKFNVVTNDDALIVHFIYVGQGDAMAINFPNGEVMLIDSGLESV